MLDVYVDRGIIKWSAFDALDGYGSMLKEMQLRLRKKAKPVLSDDDFETLNRQLKEAIITKCEIELLYYDSGYFKTTYGKIHKLDYNEKMIVLSTLERISAFDVLDLKLL
jgi:hypothetical protein